MKTISKAMEKPITWAIIGAVTWGDYAFIFLNPQWWKILFATIAGFVFGYLIYFILIRQAI